MISVQSKADLQRYLRSARETLLWKLEGLGEYDVRRPLTPTGTNLLGLVKHAAGVELGYFGETFGRPFPGTPHAFSDDAEANEDMWARADESREDVLDLYRRVAEHADATIAALPLETVGRVRWWPEDRARVTLHQVLVHVIADLQRHAGHADVVRELIDGAVGLQAGNDNMPPEDAAWWEGYRQRLEQAAREARAAG
ncbi:DinB family protein [Streptomyces sp. NPDC085942]|uniref:DinB family protein n=1 Tax=Streptomyces sp. NPDC085942 TaxID=3365743 RepID=UPI0037D07829